MATRIILELLGVHRNNRSDCFIRVSQYDCSIRAISLLIFILSTIADGQVLAMLLEVILVNFNEEITQIIMIIIMTLHFELAGSPAIICSNKGRKNNIRIIGTVWELKKNNRQFF